MSEPNEPTLDDVMTDHEADHDSEHPDRRAHAKTPKHVDDDDLAGRVAQEREALEQDRQDG